MRRSTRDKTVDGLCCAVALVATTFTVLDQLDRGGGRVPLAVEVGLGVLGALGLWWVRRRRPVELAVVAGLLSVYAVSASAVALIAVFTVAVHRRGAVALPVAATCLVAAQLPPYVRPDLPPPTSPEMLLGVVCVLAALAWGMYVRARRQVVATLRDQVIAAEARQELRVDEARRLERDRIAREMHDVLAHRLSLLSLHAGALELRPDAPAADVARSAGVIRDCAHRALEDLREVIGVLRADQIDTAPERPQPTLADLDALVEQSRSAGMKVDLDCGVGNPAVVPDGLGRTTYRIVQEGLTNARKHAPASSVSVTVRGHLGEGLNVMVRTSSSVSASSVSASSPVGVTRTIPGAGTGLVGLVERTTLAGGRLDHGRTPDGDFELQAWLPWT